MTKKLRILLILMATLLFVTVVSLGIELMIHQVSTEKEKIAMYRHQLGILKDNAPKGTNLNDELKELKSCLADEEKRFISAKNADPFAFAIDIKNKLKLFHISLDNYNTVTVNGNIISEFSFTGEPYNFIQFLKNFESSEYYSVIYSLTIKNGDKGSIKGTFRCGYAILPEEVDYKKIEINDSVLITEENDSVPIVSAWTIASLFTEPSILPKEKDDKEQPIIQDAAWISYIASVTDKEGTVFLFFKNTRNGQIISLSKNKPIGEWSLAEKRENGYLLKIADKLYFVDGR